MKLSGNSGDSSLDEAEAEPEPAPEKEPVPMPPSPDVAEDAPPPPPEATPPKPEPAPRVAEAAAPPPPPPTIPEPSAVPPPPPPKPTHIAAAKPKPEPDVVPEVKPASPDPLASLLKSVIESSQNAIKLEQKQAEAKPADVQPEVVQTASRVFDAPLSSSVSDAIRRQVESKWNVPAGAPDAADLAVEIRILLLPDGTVLRADIIDQARLSEPFYQTMAESARRAVLLSSPLRDLPPEKYEQWREITFTFRPPV